MNIHTGLDSLVGVLAGIQQKTLEPKTDTTVWLERYLNRSLEELFPAPVADPAVKAGKTRNILGLDYQTLEFQSDHLPLVDEEIDNYRRHQTPLHRFKARRISRSGTSPRRAAIHIHGLMEPGQILEDLLVGPLMTRGLDCDLYHFQLPHHGERQIRRSKYDGSQFVTADLMQTFEALRQSVLDARTVLQYVLNMNRYDEIGLTGISLGGVVTKMVASVDSRIAWAVPIIGNLDLPDVIAKAPILEEVRKELRGFGISPERVAELMELVGFTSLKPLIPRERIIVVAAEDDLIVRADSMRRQLDRWSGVQEIWITGGHLTSLFRLPSVLPDIKRRIDAFKPVR